MNIPKKRQGFHILLFVAEDFDDLTVTYCFNKLKETGQAIRLVGLVPGLVRSKTGLALQPELTLGELHQLILLSPESPQLLLIPGGMECASLLFSDPRMHHVCKATLRVNGYIAAFGSAQKIVVASGLPIDEAPSRYLTQNNMKIEQFVQFLIDLVLRNNTMPA